MASIPLVALQSKTPDILGEYGKVMQLKNLGLQQQLGQQELQKGALGLAQTQAINDAYHDALTVDANGSPTIDTDKLQNSLATNHQGAAIPGVLESVAKYQQSQATLSDTKQKILESQNTLQNDSKDALGYLGSALQKANYDPNLADVLIEQRLRTPGIQPQEQQQLTQVRQQIQQNPGIVKQVADSLVAQSPTQQKLANERQVASIRANSGADVQGMNAAIASGAIKDASEWPAYKAAQTENATIPGKAAAAAATSQAEIPAKVATEKALIPSKVAAAVQTQKELTQGGQGGALGNVPPHLVAPAVADATKADQQFTQAQQAGNEMQSMVDLAKGGNKVAYAYSPVTGVLQINVAGQIKRMNMPEIESYGAAGSALDRIKGFIGKQASGASIPEGILNDMQSVSQMVTKGAQDKYQQDIKGINSRYGAKFEPMAGGAQGGGPASNAAPPAHVPGGKAAGLTEGQTGTGSDGRKYVVKGGVWVTQ